MIQLRLTHYIVIYFMNLSVIFVLPSKFWSNMKLEQVFENILIKSFEIIIQSGPKLCINYNIYVHKNYETVKTLTRSKIKELQPNKIFCVCTSLSITEPV